MASPSFDNYGRADYTAPARPTTAPGAPTVLFSFIINPGSTASSFRLPEPDTLYNPRRSRPGFESTTGARIRQIWLPPKPRAWGRIVRTLSTLPRPPPDFATPLSKPLFKLGLLLRVHHLVQNRMARGAAVFRSRAENLPAMTDAGIKSRVYSQTRTMDAIASYAGGLVKCLIV